MAFDEDRSRARKGQSAANMSILRHIALNLVKAEKTSKAGIKTKRLKDGWDNQLYAENFRAIKLSAIALYLEMVLYF